MSDAPAKPAQEQVKAAWRDFHIWDQTAVRLRASVVRWRNCAAIGGALGAVLTTLATALAKLSAGGNFNSAPPPFDRWLGPRVAIGSAGAACLAVAPLVMKYMARAFDDRSQADRGRFAHSEAGGGGVRTGIVQSSDPVVAAIWPSARRVREAAPLPAADRLR
jgi:hypothetical protein